MEPTAEEHAAAPAAAERGTTTSGWEEGPQAAVAPAGSDAATTAPEAAMPGGVHAAAVPPPAAPAAVPAEAALLSGRRLHVVLGVSGSVATVKLAQLAQLLQQFAEVRVVATAAARYFFADEQLPASCRPVLGDADEWRQWQQVGDPVVHIELRRWADALVIAPLSANTLAKLSHGLCDNLLTCVVRAWDWHKPLLLAPAMNTFMWDSPFTPQQLAVLEGLGAVVVPPVSKRLACADVGMGAMASPADIAAACRQELVAAGFPQLQGDS